MRHEKWVDGELYVAVKACRLHGWRPSEGGGMQGASVAVQVGDKLVCAGLKPGWGSDPLPEVHWRALNGRPIGFGFAELSPSQGGWMPEPQDGLLLRLSDLLPERPPASRVCFHPQDGTAAMADLFGQWTLIQGLPQDLDAEALVCEELTLEQRAWVTDFILQWDIAQSNDEGDEAGVAFAICRWWTAVLGLDFDPSRRAADYSPDLPGDLVDDHDLQMEWLATLPLDSRAMHKTARASIIRELNLVPAFGPGAR